MARASCRARSGLSIRAMARSVLQRFAAAQSLDGQRRRGIEPADADLAVGRHVDDLGLHAHGPVVTAARELELDDLSDLLVGERALEQEAVARDVLDPTQVASAARELDGVEVGRDPTTGSAIIDSGSPKSLRVHCMD